MILAIISESSWIWAGAIILLSVSGLLFLNKLMHKGVYEKSTRGGSRMNIAFSELQTLIDPAHRHIVEERDRKRGEHDDAGDDSDPSH